MSTQAENSAFALIFCVYTLTLFAGVITIVLLTVLGQVLKAANSNPAEVVKSA